MKTNINKDLIIEALTYSVNETKNALISNPNSEILLKEYGMLKSALLKANNNIYEKTPCLLALNTLKKTILSISTKDIQTQKLIKEKEDAISTEIHKISNTIEIITPKLNKEDKIKKARSIIQNSKNIVILSGAGLDTDSGIPDFRSSSGLYSTNPEEILDINHFYKNPEETIKFIKENMFFPDAEPNRAHYILKALELNNPSVKHITQNITTLLEEAGVKNILHIHGSLEKSICNTCGKEFLTKDIETGKECDCTETSLVIPNMVFYGQALRNEFEAFQWTTEADLFIILGTSLTVHPVASLPQYTKKDTPIIVITQSETYLDNQPNVIKFNANITKTLEQLIL